MRIRRMMEKDYKLVDGLMKQVHDLHVANRPDLYVPLEHPYSEAEFLKLVRDEDVIAILAEEEQNAVGICFVTMRTKTCMVEECTAYMEDLCVDREYRGKGIGKELFFSAEKFAREKGAARLDLMVWSFNTEAMKFYESLGMKPQRCIYEKALGEDRRSRGC